MSMFENGTLTLEEFLKDCKEFLELSNRLQDNWLLIQNNHDESKTYLSYNDRIKIKSNCKVQSVASEKVQKENENSTSILNNLPDEIINVEYHVVYSISYGVPVLYFRGNRNDGSQLSINDYWSFFTDPTNSSKNEDRSEMLSILTQMDHPILFRPYLALHPCKTAELLATASNSKNRIMTTVIKFQPKLVESDPYYKPVLIIGQLRHLNALKFTDLENKLNPRVTEETFRNAISSLHPAPTDTCSLYLDLATMAALPFKSSRHNTNSRSHSITKLVKNKSLNINETIVLVCERQDLFASACAVVRAFPLYSRKTSGSVTNSQNDDSKMDDQAVPTTIDVEFILIDENCELSAQQMLTDEEIQALDVAAFGIRLAARIVDTPCNEMNVDHFVEEAKNIAIKLNIVPTIIRGEELNEKGFGGIYGVGKASTVAPALVVLSHTPFGANETIALVGKGIVYDTGGLSIKDKNSMPGMKRDCGGSAAILGAFYAAVKCGFKDNLHAIFCLAENSVGPNATRPDDIHTMYSGRTVEVNNTDAEGRLVLADGVVYAQKDLKANIILDMATLTGAQGISTGKYHGAILTNSEEWEIKALDAGRKSGDLLAPIVYCPELHFSEFASAIADMKNSVADRSNAQASCAGLFINSHIGFDFPGVWMHVDMASPVHCGERATGYGVALLLSLFGNYTNCSMLKSIAPCEFEPPSKRVCSENNVKS